MAFTLVAEFPGPVDWQELNDLVQPYLDHFEFVPIAAERFGNPNSLALSVPFKQATPHVWEQLIHAVNKLQTVYHAEVIDMYEGAILNGSMLPELKTRFLGK